MFDIFLMNKLAFLLQIHYKTGGPRSMTFFVFIINLYVYNTYLMSKKKF